MTKNTASKTLPALLCTIVFSATCVLSAVGPAIAAGEKGSAPAVRLADHNPPALLA